MGVGRPLKGVPVALRVQRIPKDSILRVSRLGIVILVFGRYLKFDIMTLRVVLWMGSFCAVGLER